MPKVPSTTTSSTDLETTFRSALEAYQKQTKKDIASHSLVGQLQSCDSPSAILDVLRAQFQALDKPQSADEKFTKWLDPTVHVLYAFSATLGNSVGLVFPPSNAVFAGIGVLLQAIKGVRASQNALVDLFSRLEYFFKRLEAYIKVRPTAAMTDIILDIIVKIMVEVLSILGIVTKEVRQGRTVRYLKELIGRKDVEDALQRLDKLTQEEARMAAAEALTITRGVDDKVKAVGERLEGVDKRVQSLDMKVEGVDEKVQSVDSKVQDIDRNVQGVDRNVQGVDRKVGSVIQRVKETGVVIQQMVNQVGHLNRNELRKDFRKWIAPPDPSVNYNAASGAHHEGTAAWCTKGNTVADWKTSGTLLWIHGKPGSGKSILSSVIIRDIESLSKASSAYMAYFFFDFKNTGKQDSRALLSSLLVQLSDQSEQLYDILLGLYLAHQNGAKQPTDDSLTQCLGDMLTITGQVPIYIIMDALDECPNDSGIPSPREKVLELVTELVELYRPNLRLCITSRPEFDIRITLDPLATQQLSLHDEGGQKQDINDYVTFVVLSDKRMKKWREDDKDAVIENLTEKADGMFRWVFCQLEVLRHCFPTNLRRVLEELPKSLDETYKRILKDINTANREHAYRLLQCLAVASRPFRVEELAEVLAFDLSAGGIPKLIADWRWEDQEEAVLSACSSLVSVIIDNGSRVVQFSHFSVKEFLISDRLASCMEDVSRFHIPIEPSHVVVAQACLGVLLRLDDRTDNNSAKKIPLVQYAAKYWDVHAKVRNVELHIKDAMDYFLDTDKPHFSAWVRIQDRYDLLRVTRDELTRSAPLPVAPLYIAAGMGSCGLVERLIIKDPRKVNAWGGEHGTPLHMSVLGGHIEVAQLLFTHGANINSRSADKQTPLHIASKEGHLEIGKWLLNHGADVNSQEKKGSTPLHFAAAFGHPEVVQMLLKCNAGVNARNDQGATPFLNASENGNPDVVRLLLDHNANPHVCDDYGVTPLLLTATNGHPGVARILLERNAEVNSRYEHKSGLLSPWRVSGRGYQDRTTSIWSFDENNGATPLHCAADFGHLDVSRILLECNAEVNAQDHRGATPVLKASESGHPDVVQLLLDHNADADVRDNGGETPLHTAATNGHLDVARILLEHDVEVNSRNNDGSTPFICAFSEDGLGHPDVALLLLDHNADVHESDSDGNTPLHLAATGGHLEVAQMLLERNAEVNARNNSGTTPFLEALDSSSPDVVHLLLEHDADVHVRNDHGVTALHLATSRGLLEVARILLKRNVEVNSQDFWGSTPLLRAFGEDECSDENPDELVQLLLEHNADAGLCDKDGDTPKDTPLHLAATAGYLKVAQILLLEHNAEVDAQNKRGATPLLNASRNRDHDVVQLLLDHNADVHMQDNEGNSPLHFAASHGRPEVVRLLLDHKVEVNTQDRQRATPILKSLNSGNSDIVQLLLDHHADADVRDNNGATLLHLAVKNGCPDVARILLEHNAEINARDNQGSTPLHQVTRTTDRDYSEIAQLLLGYNANAHVRDNEGNTPLHWAATGGRTKTGRILLLEGNAEVNARNNEGYTPLSKAITSGIVQLFLDHNADVHARDNNGNTPLHNAAARGNVEVSRILLEVNAEVNSLNDVGSTPLHLACRAAVVQVLLDYGADVRVRNLNGNTASELASGSEQHRIIQLLSKHAVE